MVDWLTTPLSGSEGHAVAEWVYWHARLMVLAWGVLLPLGALVARFYKVTPSQRWPEQLDNRFWWHAHRGLQYSGVAVMTLAAALAWNMGALSTPAARWHALTGWLLCCLGWVQVVGAMLRGTKGGPTEPNLRGDHYDMTPWRRVFERIHKGLGWLAVAGSPKVIVLGLVVVDAPRWMLLALALWWLILCVAFISLQARGRCVDTYQAIWGPDPKHPGNHMRPTGWGVRRPRKQGQTE
jgi:hypothetical protein